MRVAVHVKRSVAKGQDAVRNCRGNPSDAGDRGPRRKIPAAALVCLVERQMVLGKMGLRKWCLLEENLIFADVRGYSRSQSHVLLHFLVTNVRYLSGITGSMVHLRSIPARALAPRDLYT